MISRLNTYGLIILVTVLLSTSAYGLEPSDRTCWGEKTCEPVKIKDISISPNMPVDRGAEIQVQYTIKNNQDQQIKGVIEVVGGGYISSSTFSLNPDESKSITADSPVFGEPGDYELKFQRMEDKTVYETRDLEIRDDGDSPVGGANLKIRELVKTVEDDSMSISVRAEDIDPTSGQSNVGFIAIRHGQSDEYFTNCPLTGDGLGTVREEGGDHQFDLTEGRDTFNVVVGGLYNGHHEAWDCTNVENVLSSDSRSLASESKSVITDSAQVVLHEGETYSERMHNWIKAPDKVEEGSSNVDITFISENLEDSDYALSPDLKIRQNGQTVESFGLGWNEFGVDDRIEVQKTVDFSSLDKGTYKLSVEGTNIFIDSDIPTRQLQVVEGENQAPQVDITSVSPSDPDKGQEITVNMEISDPDGSIQSKEITYSGQTETINGDQHTFSLGSTGQHQVQVTATDNEGKTASDQTTINIEESSSDDSESSGDEPPEAPGEGEDAETYQIELSEGWNMISAPTHNNKNQFSIEQITDDCSIEETNDGSHAYGFPNSNGEYTQTDTISTKSGYWVEAKSSCTAEISSEEMSEGSTETNIAEGWNLISTDVETSISEISGECTFLSEGNTVAYWYNPEQGQYQSIDSTSNLNPLKGYWVEAKSSCTLGQSPPPTPD